MPPRRTPAAGPRLAALSGSAPSVGQTIRWNGTTWEPYTIPAAAASGPHRDSHEFGTDKVRHEYIEGHGTNSHAQIDSGLSAAAGHAAAAAPHSGHAAASHGHSEGDVAGLVSDLAGKAAASHGHAPGDVTGTAVITSDARLSDARAPTAHALDGSAHSACSDIVTGNASVSAHGLLPKLGGGTSNFLRADGTWAAPPGGGSTPAWHGALYGAWGDCDPSRVLEDMLHAPVNATPTNIGATVARIAYFRPPAAITVQKIRAFGVGATSSIYRCAIYRASDRARLTAELVFSTTAQAWIAIGSGLGVALTAGELYFIAVSVNTTGTTAGLLCLSGTTGRIGVLPASWPGNLDIDLASPIVAPFAFAQFAVTAGALPATAPTIALQAAWTGGMPAFFLDANNG